MKRTLGLLLILFALIIPASLTSCGSIDATTDPVLTTSTPNVTTTEVPATTSEPANAQSIPTALPYKENTVSDKGYIQVDSRSYISGTLLKIDENYLYQYNTSTLIPSNKIKDHVLNIKGQDLMILFGNTSQKYKLKSSKLFYKTDAFPYLDSMLSQFAQDSGKTSVQIVNSYLYSDPSTLSNEYVAGYSIAINLFENDVTYSMTSPEFNFEYGGKTVTCLDWFIENCPYYGFVFTGLLGTQQQTLASFRFVGVPHAIAMSQYDLIDVGVYNRTIKIAEKIVVINDELTGTIWYIKYQEASQNTEHTIIELPAGARYIVSGDNDGGFIVAYALS